MIGVAIANVRGGTPRRFERAALIVLADLVLQLLVVAFGLLLLFQPEVLTDPGAIAGVPSLEDLHVRVPARARGVQRHRRLLGPRGPGRDRRGAGCGG